MELADKDIKITVINKSHIFRNVEENGHSEQNEDFFKRLK